MADFRVKGRDGREIVLSSKEQVDRWVAAGYAAVTDEKPAPAKKAAPRKRSTKKN